MATSQNGYTANDRSVVSSRPVPGTDVRLTVRNGAAGDLLLYAAGRWDKEVENIDNARGALDDWGYAERPIRGSTELSNHASGTAIDLNATKHPLGTAPSANFTSAQLAAIRRILNDCDGALRWGGDYTGRKDGMHLEIIVPEKRCAQVLLKLIAVPPPSTSTYCRYGDHNDHVMALQRFMTRAFPSYNTYTPTGYYGDSTKAGIAEFQRRTGITGSDADGSVVGPRTMAKLQSYGFEA